MKHTKQLFRFCLMITGLIILTSNAIKAQVASQINYQGVARKADGTALADQNIKVRLNIKDGSATGAIVYSETRSVTTNKFGLYTVVIGSSGAVSTTGTLSGVNWATGNKFLHVEVDFQGGNNYVDMGTSQLNAVPYALHASSAAPSGNATGDLSGTYPNPIVNKLQGKPLSTATPTSGQVLQWDGSSWVPTTPNTLNQVAADWNQSNSAAVDFIKNKPNLSLKEDLANKSTNIIADSASNTKYPSVKAVKFYVDSSFSNNTGGGNFVNLNSDQTVAGVKTFSPTLTASADSTTLVGMEVSPVFNNAGYTGVKNTALKLNGDLKFGQGTNFLKFANGSMLGDVYNGGTDPSGTVDLYVPEGASWLGLSYAHRNYFWMDNTNTYLSTGVLNGPNYGWDFIGTNGSTAIPGNLEFKENKSFIKFKNGGTVGDMQNILGGSYDPNGSVDLYAPEGAGWVQMNYGNRSYIWIDQNNAYIGLQNNNTNTWYSWDFVNDGTATFPGALKLKDVTYPATDGSAGQVLTTDGQGNLSWQSGGGAGVDLTTDQNIEGKKHFFQPMIIGSDFAGNGRLQILSNNTEFDAEAGHQLYISSYVKKYVGNQTNIPVFSTAYINGELSPYSDNQVSVDNSTALHLVSPYNYNPSFVAQNLWALYADGAIKSTGKVVADSFVKAGGSSSEFLMADGSVTNGSNSFVDLSSAQTIAGNKSFSNDIAIQYIKVGSGPGQNNGANTVVGNEALANNDNGQNNTALGAYSLNYNTNGNGNTAVGTNAMAKNTTGRENTSIGSASMNNNDTGTYNAAYGVQAMEFNVDGNNNTAIGAAAIDQNASGSSNTVLGAFAGRYNGTGSFTTSINNSILIGSYAHPANNNADNEIVIGTGARGNGSNTIQLGNDAVTNMKTAGTITAGAVTYPNTTGDTGQVLTSDGSGNAYWTAPKAGARLFNSNITTRDSDKYLVYEGSGPGTVTLNSSSPDGQEIIVRSTTSSVNIVTENGQRIVYDNFNNTSSVTLANNAATSWIKLVKVGGHWMIYSN